MLARTRPSSTFARDDARARPSHAAPSHLRVAWAYVALVLLGCALELAFLAIWPLSYRLTHGGAYTYRYLVQNEPIWLKLYDALGWWEATFPGIDHSLEVNVHTLTATFAVLFGLYLAAAVLLYRVRPGRGMGPLVLGFALLFQVTLFFMPGLFTTDVFSYTMYGQIAGVYKLNPYIHLPGYFPGNELLDWITPIWHFAPSVYGPVWVDLSALLSSLVQDRPLVEQVQAYKLLINLAHLANVGLAWLLLRHFQPRTRVAGLLLFAWNPLLLFEFAGNAHNDALMLTFLLMAVLLFVYRRPDLGLVPLALSVLVKYTSALVVPFYLVLWARQQPTRLRQALVIGGGGAVVLAISLALYLPWYDGLETFAPLFTLARGPMYLNHPPDVVADLLVRTGLVGAGLHPETAQESARELIKLLTRGAFALYVVFELLRLRTRRDLVPATVRIFLFSLLVLHTWILSWYFAWPVALAALLGLGSGLGRVTLGFTFTALSITYFQHYWGLDLNPGRLLLYLSPLMVPLVEAVLRGRTSLRAIGARDVPRPWLTSPPAEVTSSPDR